jgi:hypothetical protein
VNRVTVVTADSCAERRRVVENDSQNVETKKKRGRPRKILKPEHEAACRSIGEFDNARTRRSQQDVQYMWRATSLLDAHKDSRFKWLFDLEAVMNNRPNAKRRAILAALGRIDGDDVMRGVALYICEQRPTAREAVQIIRNFRLSNQSTGDVKQLKDELDRLIADYTTRHPAMPFSRVCEALSSVLNFAMELAMQNE